MIRFLLRLLGFLVLAAGFVALVIDGTRSIAAGALSFTAASASWTAVSPDSFERVKAALSGLGVDSAFAWLVAQPTFAMLGIVGIVLMLVGRRRRRPVGTVP